MSVLSISDLNFMFVNIVDITTILKNLFVDSIYYSPNFNPLDMAFLYKQAELTLLWNKPSLSNLNWDWWYYVTYYVWSSSDSLVALPYVWFLRFGDCAFISQVKPFGSLEVPAKLKIFKINLDSYLLILIQNILLNLVPICFFTYTIFYLKTTLNQISWVNTILMSKFFHFVETEEELGSLDDSLIMLVLFLTIFCWYFLINIIYIIIVANGLNFLIFGFFVLVGFVLCIPLSVLIDFGISFSSYVRGAGNSTNLLVELVFDLIGILVVFTRFIVQNIRFVLVFAAYFEFFEWSTLSLTSLLIEHVTICISAGEAYIAPSGILSSSTALWCFLSFLVWSTISYAYYMIHLLIVLFIQLGAYFLISFWLFFFFYTSFYLTQEEKFFHSKRYLEAQ